MEIKEYIQKSQRTASTTMITEGIPPSTIHSIIGISSEAGELLDTLKKCMFYNIPLDVENIKEEVGDIMWYIAMLCRSLNLSLDTILDQNIAKLDQRYPDGFNNEDAKKRMDKIEESSKRQPCTCPSCTVYKGYETAYTIRPTGEQLW